MQPIAPSISGAKTPTGVHVVAAVGEEGPAAAVDPAAVARMRVNTGVNTASANSRIP
jgi:hypothetical protein